jgi:periplasmic protein TonB
MSNKRTDNLSDRPAFYAAIISALLLGMTPATAQESAEVVSPEPQPPVVAQASPKVLTAWRGKVLSHLASHRQGVKVGKTGVSMVAFQIDRAGRVLSAQVVKSSGNAVLDREAVELTKRASPVPAPPGEIAGGRLYLKIPIRFTR